MNQIEQVADQNRNVIGIKGRNLLRTYRFFVGMCDQMLTFFLISTVVLVIAVWEFSDSPSVFICAIASNFIWCAAGIIGSIASENALQSHVGKTLDLTTLRIIRS